MRPYIGTTALAAMRTVRWITGISTILVGAAGCKGILDVTNPGSLKEEQLTNPALEQFLVNGAIGEFQYGYGYAPVVGRDGRRSVHRPHQRLCSRTVITQL
jgi:hypothetical protein